MALRKLLLRALVPPLAAGLLLAGIIVLGRAARDALRQEPRYTLAFAELDCVPPPGGDRTAFLNEVQYLAEFPERFALLDDDLPRRLAQAFARHPCVERVDRVEVVPPRQVRVQLAYRTPVLVACTQRQQGEARPNLANGSAFAVDRHAVLLPLKGSVDDLPILWGSPLPAGPAGTPVADDDVAAAARTADFLRPHQGRLQLLNFAVVDGGLVLSHAADVRILWGRAPGMEADDEVPAAEKLRRLLAYCEEYGGLGRPGAREHDVRPKAQALHRPLP
jgi:hypothetical protein